MRDNKVQAELRRQFRGLFAFLDRMERRGRARALITAPTASMARMKREIERELEAYFETKTPEQFMADLAAAINAVAPLEHDPMARLRRGLEQQARKLAATPWGADLLGFVTSAHHALPGCTVLALLELESNAENCLEGLGLVDQAKRQRGEARARAMWSAAGRISEAVYRPFVAALWKLDLLRDGRPPSRPPEYGRIVQDLAARATEFPNLLELDCAQIRNAFAHNHVSFRPESRTVEMHDRGGRWQRSFTVLELERLSSLMVRQAGQYNEFALFPLYQACFSEPHVGLVLEVFRGLAAGDHGRAERAAALLHEAVEPSWRRLVEVAQRR